MNNIIRSTTGVLVAGMMAAACTTEPPNPAVANAAINKASTAIDSAAADPQVTKYAPDELARAQASLRQAQTIWQDKHDEQATTTQAYVAGQYAATATELAKQRAAEESVRVAAAEREHLLTSLRTARSDRQVQQQLAGLPARATSRGIVVTLPQGRFSPGTAALPADTMPMVEHLARVLKLNPGRKVIIEGHTDSTGTKDFNKTLARERADAVRDSLIKNGIEANRIVVRGYADRYPVASNGNSAGRRANRRAEVVISDTQGRVAGVPASNTSGR